jgi:predicted PurR-regulated permease PerM
VSDEGRLDAKRAALTTLVVVGILALAALAYFLIDILLLLFLGVVLAAALRPWHAKLVGWGVPKGAAVLLIYGFFLVIVGVVGLLVGPVIFEQLTSAAAGLPDLYTRVRSTLATSAPPLRMIGQRLPSFERLAPAMSDVSPTIFTGLFGLTTGLVGLIAGVLSVLAIAFYWTMELPRIERMVLSFVPVGRRAHVLTIWREIEQRLGAYMRAQGIAMLAIGIAFGVAYGIVGLPHVLMLAVLAGVLEAVPMIGPVLAAVPAVLVALPMGWERVLWVVVLATAIQVTENNVLIPRLMSRAVGVSALVGLLAVLAFGSLYGILGVFIAIPITAAVQVVLDKLVLNSEPVTEVAVVPSPWSDLRVRIRSVRRRARERLRARETRIGVDPESPEHAVDAADRQLEEAVERVEKMIAAASDGRLPCEDAELVEGLNEAAGHIEEAADRIDTIAAASASDTSRTPVVELPANELAAATEQVEKAVERVESAITATQEASGPIEPTEREAIVENLDAATRQIKDAVDDVGSLVAHAKDGWDRRRS